MHHHTSGKEFIYLNIDSGMHLGAVSKQTRYAKTDTLPLNPLALYDSTSLLT